MSKKMCNFAMDKKTVKRLDAMAEADNRSRTQEVNWLIEQAFKARVEQFPTLADMEEKAVQVEQQ